MTTPTTINSNHTRHDPARPLLVDVARAATILAISRSSVYQLIWTEQLVPVRIGRSVRFSIAQLEQFVDERIAESHP
ncbi:helix-turn-helix domain-containing protein [Ilumatobacter sp.]|uniref:helix-turn-helix domain-containing protein n=1 Tax=Ilumatobacter sp. TaxID=1967498 RepID=UPI003752A77A